MGLKGRSCWHPPPPRHLLPQSHLLTCPTQCPPCCPSSDAAVPPALRLVTQPPPWNLWWPKGASEAQWLQASPLACPFCAALLHSRGSQPWEEEGRQWQGRGRLGPLEEPGNQATISNGGRQIPADLEQWKRCLWGWRQPGGGPPFLPSAVSLPNTAVVVHLPSCACQAMMGCPGNSKATAGWREGAGEARPPNPPIDMTMSEGWRHTRKPNLVKKIYRFIKLLQELTVQYSLFSSATRKCKKANS